MFKKIKDMFFITLLCLTGCTQDDTSELKVGISTDYPPFEYVEDNIVKGFDIDLMNMIGEKLHKKIEFINIQISSIFPAVQNGTVEIGISTITATDDRKQNFDFSEPYYYETIAAVSNANITKIDLDNKKIACQLGSTVETWLKNNVDDYQLISLDNNNQAIEGLKNNNYDMVLMDGIQATTFAKKNNFIASTLDTTGQGYSILLPKNSPLTNDINQAIQNLKKEGKINEIEQKWIK
jgi:polar amino acid transport system substrate-binding protein